MSAERKKITNQSFTQAFSDEEGKKIISSYLRIILLVAVFIFPVYVSLKLIEAKSVHAADMLILGLELIYLLLLVLLKNGRTMLTGIIFLVSGWAALTLMAYYADGVKDIAIVGYIIIIFLATFFTDIRFAVIITGISIISVWVMGYLHLKTGILPKGDTPLNYSRDYTVLFLIVLASIILFARSYNYTFQRINKELKDRIKAEEKLSRNELVLKENNEELNRSNIQIRKMNEDLILARDKAEESGRLKTAFLQNVSHEIRTPMNGIVGFVSLLQQENASIEKQKEYLEFIKSCSGQLITLVNDIIDIAKIESGSLEMNVAEFRAADLCNELENEFTSPAINKGLKFSINNEAGDSVLRSDRNKIIQVLRNLVNNAIKFTYAGNVSVNLSISGNILTGSVSDTGIGIDDSLKDSVFDHFRQAEEGLTRTFGGSGLGLAISKGNIGFLGGEIWYTSEAGKGSVFYFNVPVEFANGSDKEYSHSVFSLGNRTLKVLVADDDEISAVFLKELLASNCNVFSARNGIEAVEMISRDQKFDCILMDLKMPVLNGYEAARKIKDIAPEIPIIAVTAFDIDGEIEKKAGISFDGYIIKPVEKDNLISAITALVR
jgi:Signal transduction histidine kinase